MKKEKIADPKWVHSWIYNDSTGRYIWGNDGCALCRTGLEKNMGKRQKF